MAKLFGRAYIRVNGATLASLPGTGKIDPGGVERSPVVGDAGYLGHTEKPVHGEVECEIAIDASTDIGALNKTENATITFECDSGQVFVMRNGALATPLKPQSGDGKAAVKFIGSAAEQT
jgi:hypothetical protein